MTSLGLIKEILLHRLTIKKDHNPRGLTKHETEMYHLLIKELYR